MSFVLFEEAFLRFYWLVYANNIRVSQRENLEGKHTFEYKI